MNNIQFLSEPYIIAVEPTSVVPTSLIVKRDTYIVHNDESMESDYRFQLENYSYQFSNDGDIIAPTMTHLIFGR